MSNENVCPTVPPLYTWDTGTKGDVRDNGWDKPGTKSLKALAQAFLSVPPERDKAGQRVGQTQKSCPTGEAVVGQKKTADFPPKEEKLSLEKYDTPTPEQVAYARRLMVDCPMNKWKVHVWYCARCRGANQCTAWRHLRGEVEFFRQSGKPYSLHLAETLNTETEVAQ